MTPSEFDGLAKLARLGLTPEEKEALRHQMESILGYVAKLQEVKTVNVTVHFPNVRKTGSPLRTDEPADSLPASDALAQAPKKAWDFFSVPQILED